MPKSPVWFGVIILQPLFKVVEWLGSATAAFAEANAVVSARERSIPDCFVKEPFSTPAAERFALTAAAFEDTSGGQKGSNAARSCRADSTLSPEVVRAKMSVRLVLFSFAAGLATGETIVVFW